MATSRHTLAKLGIEANDGDHRPSRRQPRIVEKPLSKPEPTVPEVPQEINEQTAMAMKRLGGRMKDIEARGWKQTATVVVFAATNYHYGYRIYALGKERRSRFFFEGL